MQVDYYFPKKSEFHDDLSDKQVKDLFARNMADPDVERITVFKNRKQRRAEAAEERKAERRKATEA